MRTLRISAAVLVALACTAPGVWPPRVRIVSGLSVSRRVGQRAWVTC